MKEVKAGSERLLGGRGKSEGRDTAKRTRGRRDKESGKGKGV